MLATDPYENATSQTVLCAMSGGVDSSVAALLLCEEGFDVRGATMELFDVEGAKENADAEDAREVCQRLGIPHGTLDLKERFATCVIDTFCASYLDGRTPNPCIQCNRTLKLASLQQVRRARGMGSVATGHYVRRAFDPHTGTWQLLRAADPDKDQSYVLYHLTQEDLAHMLFPLGDLTKDAVRRLAAEQGFGNAQKAESQDICFVPDGDHVGFIARRCGMDARAFAPGDIVDETGAVRGQHQGLIRYTLGQRKGIGIANAEPLYVKAKDVAHGRLIVAPRAGLLTSTVAVEDVNVISGDTRPRTCAVTVKLSYRQDPVPAEIQLLEDRKALIRLAEPQTRPAPGQSAVAYVGDVVLCGGTVSDVSPE